MPHRHADPPREPPNWSLLREGLIVLEVPRLARLLPVYARAPRGDGGPVLVLPGFGTGDASTVGLRTFIQLIGYRARGWELGINRGDVGALLPQVIERTLRAADRGGRKVRLVGWSLGGTLARETARERPDLVECVVTLGTPAVGGPKYTAVGAAYRRQGYDLDAIEREVAARERHPIRVPVTAIYSRGDGVVAWQACIDRHTPGVEHVEVRGTHTGLGFNPDAYLVIAQRLPRPS
jgi:hypothetical protein